MTEQRTLEKKAEKECKDCGGKLEPFRQWLCETCVKKRQRAFRKDMHGT